MGLVILIILVIFITIIDKKIYGTYYTPSVMLSFPFLLICILYDLNAENLGFYPLNYNVLFIWVFGIIIFWLTGIFTNLIIKVKANSGVKIDRKKEIYFYSNKIVNFSFIVSLILSYYLINAFQLYNSSGGDAVEEYLGGGFQGHLIIVLKLVSTLSFISLLGKGNKIFKLKNLYVVCVALSLAVLYATKSGVLILLLSYFFSWILFFNKKIKILYVAIFFGLGFGIFYVSYSMVFGYLAPVDFIWSHMIMYYVSGTAGMNAYFSQTNIVGVDPELLYRYFFNLFYTITGNQSEVKTVISDLWTNIGNGYTINVKTFFGTIYVYGGEVLGTMTVIYFSFITHLVFKLSKINFMALVLYTHLLAMLCFGWFDLYFNSVLFYESIIIAFILSFILIANKQNERKFQ